MNKFLSVFFLLLFLFCFFVPFASAQTFTVYENASESGTYQILCNMIPSDDRYKPFDDYVIFRSTQYGYYAAFGDLSKPFMIGYVYDSLNRSYHYEDLGQLSSFSLSNPNDYIVMGNADFQIHSNRLDEYKYRYVMLIFAFVFLTVFLFKSFKINYSTERRIG